MSLIVLSVGGVFWLTMLVSYRFIRDSRRYITASWGFLALYALYQDFLQWFNSPQTLSERQQLDQVLPDVNLASVASNGLTWLTLGLLSIFYLVKLSKRSQASKKHKKAKNKTLTL